MKTGVLMHVYHLEAIGWEELVWGNPQVDQLGTAPLLVWVLLTEPHDAPIERIMIGCGPSVKDGLSEAAYTKRFILERFESFKDFPRLAPLLARLDDAGYARLKARLAAIELMKPIRRTREEVAVAAAAYSKSGIDRVIQLCAASHAPRCVQIQATSRRDGLIPPSQQWFVIPSDTCFLGLEPGDTVIVETPHRGDYALTHERPTLAEVLRPTLYMPDDGKRELIRLIKDFDDKHQD